MLSAVFTFGLYVAGHFSADLRNFEASSTRPLAARSRAALYYAAAEHGDVRRQERRSCTASRCRRRTSAERPPTARCTSSRCCSPASLDLLAAGLQVDAGARSARRLVVAAGLAVARAAAAGRARARYPERLSRRTRPLLLVRRGGAGAWRCRTTSLLADLYWIRAVQSLRRARSARRAARDPDATTCSTRCST